MAHFREEQKFPWYWTAVTGIPATVIAYVIYRQQWMGRPLGDQPIAGTLLWPALAVTGSVLVWFMRMRLITEARDDVLSIRFVSLWPERSIEWNQIRSAKAVTYRPILDYGGWGVRWGERAGVRGIVFNVSGNRGVRIDLNNGERVMLGSQVPDELVRAIAEHTAR
ncbi:MAG: hypothetical protein U0Q18_01140 [Bryobacteraceae bacterium]